MFRCWDLIKVFLLLGFGGGWWGFCREPSEEVNTGILRKLIEIQVKSPSLTQSLTICQGGSLQNQGLKLTLWDLTFGEKVIIL